MKIFDFAQPTTIRVYIPRTELLIVLLFVMAFAVTGCSDDDSTEEAAGSGISLAEELTEDAVGSIVPDDWFTPAAATTINDSLPSVTLSTVLPGNAVDVVEAGTVLVVSGLAIEEELNLRKAPGIDQPVVSTLSSADTDIIASGRARQLATSTWYEVAHNGSEGWVSSAYLGQLGDAEDITSQVVSNYGSYPVADSVRSVGDLVVATELEGEVSAKAVVVSNAREGDLGVIVYDLVGFEDSPLPNERLVVHVRPPELGVAEYSLASVELSEFR